MHKFVILTLLILSAAGCREGEWYPRVLVEADSAFVQGKYQTADSLVAAYDRTVADREAKADGRGIGERRYRQLLGLCQQYVRDELSAQDFALADSLRNYYNKGSREKRGKALLFLGEAYRLGGDNPSALDCYLQAREVGRECGDLTLQTWACQELGDVYFFQRMLDECKKYYREYYALSSMRQDTLRMAFGAHRMGQVCTIENQIDSIIFYYEEAIRLGQTVPQRNDIVPAALFNLCDIYIQTEEFEKAFDLMPRDSLNTVNWAYWYLGQHHVDSAIFYFNESLGKYSIHAEVENLRILAQLEHERGNERAALDYYERLLTAEDSLKAYTQAEETRRTEAQYNIAKVKAERDALARKTRRSHIMLIALMVLIGIAAVSVWLLRRRMQRKYSAELTRERLLRQQMELAAILANASSEELGIKPATGADSHLPPQWLERLELFQRSPLFLRLSQHKGDPRYRLSEEEWQELIDNVNHIFNRFTERLLTMADLNSAELRVCCLVKLGVKPAEMALLLHKSRQGISMMRSRLYKKIALRKGSAENFDALMEKL